MPEPDLGFAASLLMPDQDGHSSCQRPDWVPIAPPGTSLPDLLGQMIRRAVLRSAGLGSKRLLPLRPASLRTGPRASARRWLHSGLLAVPGGDGFPSPRSPLGRVAREAGLRFPAAAFWPASGGTLVAPAQLGETAVVLRVFPATGIERHGETERTLRHLEDHRVPRVPRVLAVGRTEGLPWLVESRMPGARPRRLSGTLVAQVTDFCVDLPAHPGLPAVVHAPMPNVLAPDVEERLRRLGRDAAGHWSGESPVGSHGDLWQGNLLETRDGLGGVVDWDAFRTSAVPGVDVFHLFATAERLGMRRSMGAELLSRPWSREPLRSTASAYFGRLGLRVDEDRWTATGVAWWLGQLVDTLLRTPELARDEAWTSRNIESVLGSVG